MVQMYEGFMAWLSLFCLGSERRIRTTRPRAWFRRQWSACIAVCTVQSIAMMLKCLHERMRKASGQEECNAVDCIESFFQWHTCVLTGQKWLVDSRPCPTSDNIFDEYVCHGQVRCPAEFHWTLAADGLNCRQHN